MDKRIPVSMFEAAADLWPGRTAIDAPDGTLTYAELNHAADSAAGCLVQDDFGAGSIAAVFIPNSAAYIASVIGVQKAGGAFMPVDPKTPYERQARMFALAEPSVVIVDNVHLPVYREFAGRSGFVPRLLMVMSPHGAVRLYPSGGCDSVEPDSVFLKSGKLPAPDDDLYVIFTSGTTGVPKAVLGRQKGLAHFLAWERTEFGLDETVRASNLAPTTFDVSLRDIFVPLTAGGTVVVPEESIKTNPGALLGWVMEKELTLVHIVPSMFRLLLDELEKIPEKERLLPNMQYVMLAGEAVYGRDVLRFRKVMGDGVQLINLYGPSETTLAKLFNRLDFIPENPGKIMPVGRPISNTAVIILKNNRLAEIGEIGEICIKTPFCSKGYLRDPALTATVFVANPITNDPGDIIYRTGDMGRYMSDRSVEFAGRLDRQVKVNGVRVELCEVDEAVNSYPGVKQALVIPHVREDGETSLICYYTETQPVDRGALREHLSRFLYSAMIPSFFVRIEGFPLGINGKINYRALPRPEEIIYQDSDYVAPETVTEKRVAAIWSEILGIEKIGVLTSFNTLGGGSMQAIRCLGRLSREFEIEISLHDFFRTADVRRLAELIESAVESSSLKAIQPQPERPDYPATHSQKRLWMLQKMIPGFTAFNITGCYRVQGELDTEILDRALKKVASRHEILRTVFFEQAGELRQRVKSEPDIHLERLEQAETANDVIRIAEAFFQTVFDIERGPLFRIGVFSGNEGTLLVFVIHHSICDAWSLDLILNETMKLYRGIAANEEETTPPPALQYRDYADWQNTRLTAEGFDAQRRYWLERLKGELPRLDLPLDRPRPARRDYRGATVSYTFPQSLLDKAKAYSAGSGRTLFPILVAGLRALLFRYTGQTEIILNSPVTLRGRSELESMPGDFTNTILLRGTVSDEKPFAAMIDEAVEEVGQAMAHRDYPFDLLAADLNVSRDLSRASISDVGITLVEDLDDAEPPVTGLRFEPVTVDAGISKYDMVFHFNLSSGGLIVAIEYDSVIFRKGRIQRMAANLSALLDHGLTLPGTAVSALDVVDAAERSLIESFQFPRPRGYTDLTIHGEFERVARKHSDDCALVMRDGSCISYADLDYEANTVADMLLAHGYGGGERIAVHMHRGTDVPIAILGILKAGCVYVPVAADCPPTRISHILDDCGAVAAIVSGGLEKNLPGGITCLDIADAKRFPGKPHAVDVKPDDAAYIIYTSGSTGRPKGVLLQHLGIVNRARDLNERIAITSKDRFTQFASLSFDASLYEIFCALLNGASLMVVERDIINNTDAFINLLGNMKVTFTLLPPAYLRQLRRRKLPGIRVLKTAGEAADVNDALHYAREAVYLNGYGPTEDSICSTVFTVDPKGDYPLGIPIGGPVGDTEALVLDSSLRAVPVGVPGQLCVSDRGLAHGYVNLPEQTAKAFVPHPGDSAKRIYLTGDCVRWNEDGSLLFMGRIDNQVKIAGHRIEPGEIESVMRGIDGIADVCVTTVGEAGDLRLAAYYTGSAGAGGLRSKLIESLPGYLVPHFFIRMDALPLNASGKINRAALPQPGTQTETACRDAATENEIVLLQTVRNVLGNRSLGVDANFFAAGGDSIRAIQVAARLLEQGWTLSVADFFVSPVIGELALTIRRVVNAAAQEPVSGPLRPTPVLEWFVRKITGCPEHFNQAVLLKSAEQIDAPSLQHALEAVWRHHDALRMVYDDGRFSILPETAPFTLVVADLSAAEEPDSVILEIAETTQAGFQLAAGPLLKAVLFRRAGGDRLLVAAHHLVVDVVSWSVFARDVESAYRMARRGEHIALPPKSHSFRDWADTLHRRAEAGTFDNEISFWKKIAEAECETIGVSGRDGTMQTMSIRVADGEVAGLFGDGASHEPLAKMLAALACALHRWNGMNRVRLMLEGHGRGLGDTGLDISRTIGWFTVLWPFVLECGQEVQAAFDTVQASLKSVPNLGAGYGVLRYLAGHEELDAIAEISFNYIGKVELAEGLFSLADEPSGQTVNPANRPGQTFEFLLSADGDAVIVHLSYDSGRVSPPEALRLLDLYREWLIRAAECQSSAFDYSDFGEGGINGFLESI